VSTIRLRRLPQIQGLEAWTTLEMAMADLEMATLAVRMAILVVVGTVAL
jgi:hypothetical protein